MCVYNIYIYIYIYVYLSLYMIYIYIYIHIYICIDKSSGRAARALSRARISPTELRCFLFGTFHRALSLPEVFISTNSPHTHIHI